MTIRKDTSSAANKSEAILEYENFRHVCYKWQFKVNISSIFEAS